MEFPSVILCSPGNNMAALPNISLLLDEEWREFWSVRNKTVIEEFEVMSRPLQVNKSNYEMYIVGSLSDPLEVLGYDP